MAGKTWLASLAGVLAVFLVVLRWTWSPAWFGFAHDDSLYWSSAQALAEQRGYVMPSIPGEPPQTKYPRLYPWILSWVWRWDGGFPANLAGAFWVNALFGAAFLAGSGVLLRQLGAGPSVAVGLTAYSAVHPQMLNLSSLLLSDVPFMAFAMASAVCCELGLSKMSRGEKRGWVAWVAGVLLAALALGTRSIGVAVVAGACAAAVVRRMPKAALVMAGVGAVAVVPRLFGAPPANVPSETGASGYAQTMLFYTSYLGFWRFSVPDLATLWDQTCFNLLELLKTPATLVFLTPTAGFASPFWQGAGVALSAGILRACFRGVGIRTWHPIQFMFLFHIPIVLLWNYTLMERLLLLFLPLFLWGAFQEVRGLLLQGRDVFRQRKPWGDRVAAGMVLSLLAALLAYAGYRELWASPFGTAEAQRGREMLAAEKAEAYRWIHEHTSGDDRFIAYEDVNLYLHTGRQSLRPLAVSTASFFRQDKAILERELDHLGDTARALGARYWLVAADDFHLESGEEFLAKATDDLLGASPAVFVASGGKVRIYDISNLTRAGSEVPRPAVGGKS